MAKLEAHMEVIGGIGKVGDEEMGLAIAMTARSAFHDGTWHDILVPVARPHLLEQTAAAESGLP